ncbi:MAG: hypothetical protein FWH14_07260 [Oscillospiraceae bacterium]|nr:hypothetical protein [Oscillospiraceae bacterium]
MLNAYEGYFLDGKFISAENINIKIPDKKKVTVTVHNEFVNTNIDICRQQLEAFEVFFKSIDAIDDKFLTDEDFFELENNRINFKEEINL